ncbi:Aste57867_10115 [Aphanomyces stellatus]|uniref:Aste57867_10115 protein n=1 Tax=Aphanomyces stellatus TaxID=120398 RepID=A0A485KQ00_9STRA|nr:hypothetical protein As57867_010076 [Aphanomyces stellatus]VFT86991.1 Aste57867_10115 [Aphanomyces stellatus]
MTDTIAAEQLVGAARQALSDALASIPQASLVNVAAIEAALSQVESLVGDLRRALPREAQKSAVKEYGALVPTPQHAKEAQAPENHPSIWSGFYNKTLRERMDVLSLMYPSAIPRRGSDADAVATQGSPMHPPRKTSIGQVPSFNLNTDELGHLPSRTANLMIENCIGVLGIPLGLGLNFVIDGANYSVPMAVEEPSVVAAASSAAKLIASHGGFVTATSGNIMTSQIQLLETKDIAAAIAAIDTHRDALIEYANTNLCSNMAKRGGGVVHIAARVVHPADKDAASSWYAGVANDELHVQASGAPAPFVVVHVDVDVCEAMGANIVNTIAEGLSAKVATLTASRAGLRILTNLCTARRARASFQIPVAAMGWKGTEGTIVAQRILEANDFAINDPFRAVTNNKGILNGIDAAAVATGQDWRAIEAAAHCYASRTGRYTSLTQYKVTPDGMLHGILELPMAVGSKGGALQTHPGYNATHAILGRPTAAQLSGILVSVGLAQNFAAIRALAITGINQGHMALHARNIAVAAGAPNELVSELCGTFVSSSRIDNRLAYMLARGSVSVDTAKAYLKAHAVYNDIHAEPTLQSKKPSMLYVEIAVPGLAKPVSVNLAFLSLQSDPQTIVISKHKQETSKVHAELLGDKGYIQLERMFMFLASMRVIVGSEHRTNLELQNKILLLSILINVVAYQLTKKAHAKPIVQTFIRELLVHNPSVEWADAYFDTTDAALSTGLPLLLALWQVFHYHIDQEVSHELLQHAIAHEQADLLASIANASPTIGDDTDDADAAFAAYMATHAKRWQATMFLLVDCLALDNATITPARLATVKQVGRYIEWEGTVAHDMARYERALADAEERNVCVWFKTHHVTDNESMDAALAAFKRVSRGQMQAQWDALQAAAAASDDFVHVAALEQVVNMILSHYRDASTRKMSF